MLLQQTMGHAEMSALGEKRSLPVKLSEKAVSLIHQLIGTWNLVVTLLYVYFGSVQDIEIRQIELGILIYKQRKKDRKKERNKDR